MAKEEQEQIQGKRKHKEKNYETSNGNAAEQDNHIQEKEGSDNNEEDGDVLIINKRSIKKSKKL
jgi:hypothetical protein